MFRTDPDKLDVVAMNDSGEAIHATPAIVPAGSFSAPTATSQSPSRWPVRLRSVLSAGRTERAEAIRQMAKGRRA